MDWNDLLSQVQKGNCLAREKLCRHARERLLSVAQFRLRGLDKTVHEEVVQEAMLTVVEKLDGISENPHYFALVVLRNKIGDLLRRRKSSAAHPQGVEDDDFRESHDVARAASVESGQDIEGDVERRDLIARIARAVSRLPLFCRTYYRAVFEGCSVSEIFQRQRQIEPDLIRATFDSRVHRCRNRLKAVLDPNPEGRNRP